MNSNYGRSTKSSSLDFDLGIGSNRSRSLNDQKNKTSSYASPFTSTQPKPNSSATSPWQPRPAWTHQPAPTQSARPGLPGAPTSMVGDIHGRSWASSGAAPSVAAPSIGIVNKNPNLFGDLVNSALGQNKGNNNVPLKNVTPVFSQGSSNKGLNSMGKMADSLPKTGSSVKSVNGGGWGSSESFGSFTSASKSNNNNSNVKSTYIGGSSMNSGIGGGMSSMKDPFGVLLDFSAKKESNLNSAAKGTSSKPVASGNDSFGDFQNAAKSSEPSHTADPFANFSHNFSGSKSGSYTNVDFAIPTQTQPPVQSSGANVFDSLFTSSATASGGSAFKGSDDGLGNQQFSGGDDWGTDPGFGGGNDSGGTTTELEGLPPPPSGVSASTAKNKGMDNYKQGQYPDAIKWLSWAVVLLEKSGNVAATMEVLSSRASCYKEVGEYKKAVADCTKVLEHDGENVGVLVQRALLYESMEKYKLGADDLRAVMKIDPGNRVARSTVHRLTKMAG